MPRQKKNETKKNEIQKHQNANTYSSQLMQDALRNVARMGMDYQKMAEQISPLNNSLVQIANRYFSIMKDIENSALPEILKNFSEINTGVVSRAIMASSYLGLQKQLKEAEDSLDKAPEIIEAELIDVDEKEKIFEQIKSLKNELSTLRSENEKLKEKFSKFTARSEKTSKRGRKTPTDEVKLSAIRKWDAIDKSFNSVSLEEFLGQEFGKNPDGSPVVPTPTFHGWRVQLRKKGFDV